VNAIPRATYYIFVSGIEGGRQGSISFVRFGGYNGGGASVVMMELGATDIHLSIFRATESK